MIDCKGNEYTIVDVGNAVNIIGETFGDLVVVNRVKMKKNGQTRWLCMCKNCGNEICVTAGHLNDGSTTSCGCKRKKENKEIEKMLSSINMNEDK